MTSKEREKKNFEEKEIEFKVDSQKLKGTLFIPDGKYPFPSVVFYHGSNSNRVGFLPICQDLAKQGLAALTFDFRGDGESEGEISCLSLAERGIDAHEALNFLLRQSVINNKRLGICGVSMGAPQAVLMAALKEKNIRSLVLRAPAVYNNEYEGELFGTYKQTYKSRVDWQGSTTFNYLSRFKGDLLIVESEHDEVIPHRVVEHYLSRAKKARSREFHVIKGANHYLGDANSPYRQEFKKVVVDWFAKTLK